MFFRSNNDKLKRYTLLRFNDSLNVEPENWVNEKIQLVREDNRAQVRIYSLYKVNIV